MKVGSKVALITDYGSESIQWCFRKGVPVPEKEFVYTVSELSENKDPNRLFVHGIKLKEYTSIILFNKNDWREIEPPVQELESIQLEIPKHIAHLKSKSKSPFRTSSSPSKGS